ncbi:MAG: urate hydroxylase PuuD [Usitatibacter sp.]
MEAYVLDWLNLLGRWIHVITGIAWIGASFYFVWLDDHLEPPGPELAERGVGGELWAVHGGGFYHAQKYRVAPPALPRHLHWFKWEAYSTLISGFFLLCLVYYVGADLYLIDRSVADLSRAAASGIGLASLAGGWIVYDLLCRSPLGRDDRALGVAIALLLAGAAYGLCHVFSARGAFIHFGAMIGTIMVLNVFFVIMPGQRELVAAAAAGRPPDPAPGLRAKQRSVHNTYFTLPVLFSMISTHYAMLYAGAYNWLTLFALSLAGALVRVYFVARHKGRASPWPLVAAGLLGAGIVAALVPARAGRSANADFTRVRDIVNARCVACHSANPTQPGFTTAPKGLAFDAPERIAEHAGEIGAQVTSRAMPLGNLTHMTDEERAAVGAWAVREKH